MPSMEHENCVKILNDVATMMGFSTSLNILPDGTKPDVLRFNVATNGVFLGEAKATESPNCTATRLRYQNYVKWLSTSRAAMNASICGICFGECSNETGWQGLLVDMLVTGGLTVVRVGLCRIDFPVGLVWVQLG